MYGNTNAKRKLTEGDVRLMRELWDEKKELMRKSRLITLRGLAEKFGVAKTTVEKIVNGERWTMVK